MCLAVLQIRDILVQIRIHPHLRLRIWILIISSVTFKMASKSFFAFHFLKLHLHYFSKITTCTVKKKQNSRTKGFSYYFRLMIEGYGSGPCTI
jgi:hypothetical protein